MATATHTIRPPHITRDKAGAESMKPTPLEQQWNCTGRRENWSQSRTLTKPLCKISQVHRFDFIYFTHKTHNRKSTFLANFKPLYRTQFWFNILIHSFDLNFSFHFISVHPSILRPYLHCKPIQPHIPSLISPTNPHNQLQHLPSITHAQVSKAPPPYN